MLHFPCEAAETKMMAGAMRRLLTENTVQSIIWLHDGMYLNKEVPTDKATKAINAAAAECGIRDILVKITDCRSAITNQTYQPENTSDRSIALEAAIAAETIIREGIGIVNSADKPLGRIKPVLKKAPNLHLNRE
jgi:hypothetical protein